MYDFKTFRSVSLTNLIDKLNFIILARQFSWNGEFHGDFFFFFHIQVYIIARPVKI